MLLLGTVAYLIVFQAIFTHILVSFVVFFRPAYLLEVVLDFIIRVLHYALVTLLARGERGGKTDDEYKEKNVLHAVL